MKATKRFALSIAALSIASALHAVAPAAAVDCYPPGSCDNSQAQTYTQVPAASTSFGNATAKFCSGNSCTDAAVTKTSTSSELTISVSGGPTVRIKPVSTGGTPAQVSSDGTLVIPATGGVNVVLSGLQPGSFVDVYLNTERFFLGKAKVRADGTVQATLPLPAGVTPGLHTAQVIGTTTGGRVVSANVGLLVKSVALLPGISRLVFTSARPLPTWTPAAGTKVTLKAGLINVVNGNKVNGPASATLKKCSATVSVKDASGKTLLSGACMTFAVNGEGKANYDWVIPANVKGKVKATFTFRETGRVASVINRTFTVVG